MPTPRNPYPAARRSAPVTIYSAPDAATASQAPRETAASPVVRKVARQHSVDLAAVKGTGAGGRISLADVRAAGGIPAPVAESAEDAAFYAAYPEERPGAATGRAAKGMPEVATAASDDELYFSIYPEDRSRPDVGGGGGV